jgi:exopolyphosphatase / guanosine-5'-triphosphate,3'-diphosphate pyrophosphatase
MTGIIDLGTNTFNLVVGTVQGKYIHLQHTTSVAVGLGKGGIESGIILPEAYQRGVAAMKQLTDEAVAAGATMVKAVGTSALRNASNAFSFIEEVASETGVNIQIIDGMQEAQLIWEGVRLSGALNSTNSLLVDIGGGSVEFIIANERQLQNAVSLEIGMARLNTLFPLEDPVSPAQLADIDTWLREKLEPVVELLKRYPVQQFCGSAGSFDTLSEIHASLHFQQSSWKNSTSYLLRRSDFDELYELLLLADRDTRAKMPGMLPIRVDMIVYAVILIRLLADKLKCDEISCSKYSLREGLLATSA